jgi:hypothetical protein
LTDGGRRAVWERPIGYAVVSLLLCLAGLAVVIGLNVVPPGMAAIGALAAWAVQAVAVWKVVGALDDGRSVLRPWVAGIGARIGGLAAAFVASFLTERVGEGLALAYGGVLLILLLLEAVWLALRRQGRPAGLADRGRSTG